MITILLVYCGFVLVFFALTATAGHCMDVALRRRDERKKGH